MIDFRKAKNAINQMSRAAETEAANRDDVVSSLLEALEILDLIASMHSSFGAALHVPTNNLDRAYWLAVQAVLYPAPEAAE